MSQRNGLDLLDAVKLGAVGLLLWWWFTRGGSAFGIGAGGGVRPVTDAGRSPPLQPDDLQRLVNMRDITPRGPGPVGTQPLKNAAPLALKGINSLGYGVAAADAEAAELIERYRIARDNGTLAAVASGLSPLPA